MPTGSDHTRGVINSALRLCDMTHSAISSFRDFASTSKNIPEPDHPTSSKVATLYKAKISRNKEEEFCFAWYDIASYLANRFQNFESSLHLRMDKDGLNEGMIYSHWPKDLVLQEYGWSKLDTNEYPWSYPTRKAIEAFRYCIHSSFNDAGMDRSDSPGKAVTHSERVESNLLLEIRGDRLRLLSPNNTNFSGRFQLHTQDRFSKQRLCDAIQKFLHEKSEHTLSSINPRNESTLSSILSVEPDLQNISKLAAASSASSLDQGQISASSSSRDIAQNDLSDRNPSPPATTHDLLSERGEEENAQPDNVDFESSLAETPQRVNDELYPLPHTSALTHDSQQLFNDNNSQVPEMVQPIANYSEVSLKSGKNWRDFDPLWDRSSRYCMDSGAIGSAFHSALSLNTSADDQQREQVVTYSRWPSSELRDNIWPGDLLGNQEKQMRLPIDIQQVVNLMNEIKERGRAGVFRIIAEIRSEVDRSIQR